MAMASPAPVLLVEPGKVQQGAAESRVHFRGLPEMGGGFRQLFLARQRLRQPQVRLGGLGVRGHGQAEILFGLLRRAGLQLRLGQEKTGLEFGGFPRRGGFQEREGVRRLLVAHQQHAQVQLGLIQAPA